MSYPRMANVTMIEELPNLEDIDGGGGYIERQIMDRPNLQDDRFQKHIRPTHRIDPQAGMENAAMAAGHEEMMYQQPMLPQLPVHMTYNCVDVSKHIQDCPICSKFYHDDKSVYIIVIILLCIVCLLLLKRVLNV